MKSQTRLGLVRHGQTHANIEHVWHGQTDTALTELGHRQARLLGRHFHHYMEPEVIYASPLQRARLTAEAVAARYSIPVQLDPRLMEFDLGDWEGATFESLRGAGNIMEQLVRNPDFSAPNGESQNLVRKRMVEAIEDITHRHPQQNIVIVAHGVAIGIALSHLIEGDTTRWPNYTKDNTAFSELCLSTNTLLSYNKTDHLEAGDR
ncbi:MAG: histidine phosphatase family protein [Gammaproteobacteria bacterium]|nr:histidine phosphatase family protein [Gammaproteobacteria bacterium]